jgi:hypothetical protein
MNRNSHHSQQKTQQQTAQVVPPVVPTNATHSKDTVPVVQSVSTNADVYKEALELAYPLAVESYKEAERRLDIAEKRLQDLTAFMVTVTLGVVAVMAGKVNLRDWPFIVGFVCAAVGVGIGIVARLMGGLILISPRNIYEKHLVKTSSQFKLDFVGAAGNAREENEKHIRRKAFATGLVIICFLAEAIFLSWGAIRVRSSEIPQNPARAVQAVGVEVQPAPVQAKKQAKAH